MYAARSRRARTVPPMKTLGVLAVMTYARVSSCDPVGTVDGPGARSYDAQAYSLTASFDWQQKRLHASELITLVTAPGQELIEPTAAVDRTSAQVGPVHVAFTP